MDGVSRGPRLAVLATDVTVIAAFVKVFPVKGVVAVAGVPIRPLPVNWNVLVSVCVLPAKAPNIRSHRSEVRFIMNFPYYYACGLQVCIVLPVTSLYVKRRPVTVRSDRRNRRASVISRLVNRKLGSSKLIVAPC